MIKSHYSWWLRGPSPRSEKGPDFEPPTHLMIFCLEARAIKPQAVALSLRWWRGVFKTGIIPCRPERNHMASWQTLVSGAWRSYGWELQLNIFFFFFLTNQQETSTERDCFSTASTQVSMLNTASECESRQEMLVQDLAMSHNENCCDDGVCVCVCVCEMSLIDGKFETVPGYHRLAVQTRLLQWN